MLQNYTDASMLPTWEHLWKSLSLDATLEVLGERDNKAVADILSKFSPAANSQVARLKRSRMVWLKLRAQGTSPLGLPSSDLYEDMTPELKAHWEKTYKEQAITWNDEQLCTKLQTLLPCLCVFHDDLLVRFVAACSSAARDGLQSLCMARYERDSVHPRTGNLDGPATKEATFEDVAELYNCLIGTEKKRVGKRTISMDSIQTITIKKLDIPPVRNGEYGSGNMGKMLQELVKLPNLKKVSIGGYDNTADPKRSRKCPSSWHQARLNHIDKAIKKATNSGLQKSLRTIRNAVEEWRDCEWTDN